MGLYCAFLCGASKVFGRYFTSSHCHLVLQPAMGNHHLRTVLTDNRPSLAVMAASPTAVVANRVDTGAANNKQAEEEEGMVATKAEVEAAMVAAAAKEVAAATVMEEVVAAAAVTVVDSHQEDMTSQAAEATEEAEAVTAEAVLVADLEVHTSTSVLSKKNKKTCVTGFSVNDAGKVAVLMMNTRLRSVG